MKQTEISSMQLLHRFIYWENGNQTREIQLYKSKRKGILSFNDTTVDELWSACTRWNDNHLWL